MTLILSATSKLGEVVRIRWLNGRADVVVARTDAVRQDAERWIRRGLVEWLGEPGRATQRITPASDPRFMGRLKAYLEQQFRFRVELTETPPREIIEIRHLLSVARGNVSRVRDMMLRDGVCGSLSWQQLKANRVSAAESQPAPQKIDTQLLN